MKTNRPQTHDQLPHVAFVATGGTIAGNITQTDNTCWYYESAQLSGESLVMGIPSLLHCAKWHFEQPYNIGSQNLELKHMLQLRTAVLRLLQLPEIDGIIVAHGTDTMEDMLYFLYLTLPTEFLTKPLIFTGAMLPLGHQQSDGPSNIIGALQFLTSALGQSNKAVPFGLNMQGTFTPAVGVKKNCTEGLAAFNGSHTVLADENWFSALMSLKQMSSIGEQGQFSHLFDFNITQHSLFEAIEIAIVFFTPGNSALHQLNDLLNRKPAALVFAAPGHGNIPDSCVPVLRRLLCNGVSVVRASRISDGVVQQGGEFHALDEFRKKPVQNGQGFFSESGHLSLSKCAIYERLRILAHSLSFRE